MKRILREILETSFFKPGIILSNNIRAWEGSKRGTLNALRFSIHHLCVDLDNALPDDAVFLTDKAKKLTDTDLQAFLDYLIESMNDYQPNWRTYND